MKLELKKFLYCSNDLIWYFFEKEIGLPNNEIQALVKERVKETFKIMVGEKLKIETLIPTQRFYKLSKDI